MGHLLAALAVKMKVNTFSVGFGPAIKSWKWKGIDWRLSWIPLGGYVSIYGMDDSQTGPGSYYAAPVYKRIIVIAMGPIVNILLAWAFFAGIHATGGLPKPFSEVTNVIGWVDQKAPLLKTLVPGDHILSYDGKKFTSAKDHIYLPLLAKGQMSIGFEKVDYVHGLEQKGEVKVDTYSHPEAVDSAVKTVGILASARWLNIEGFSEASLISKTMLSQYGAQVGDQIVAVNGQRLFSDKQLLSVLNQSAVWVAVERGNQTLSFQVPLVPLADLGAFGLIQLEWRDWLFGVSNETPLFDRRVMGLDIDLDGYVQSICFPESIKGLQVGDRLLSINGEAFENPKKLCEQIQNPAASVILYRPSHKLDESSFENAQLTYFKIFSSPDLQELLDHPFSLKEEVRGDFIKLKPYKLIPFHEIAADQLSEWKDRAKLIVDETSRSRMLKMIEDKSREKVLGVRLSDQQVLYNPTPNEMMVASIKQIGSTLNALLSGQLSPKWLAGPVGMVTVMSQSFATGFKPSIYWLAMISLNLGLFNLLPLPIFDGGRIILETIEGLTGRRLPNAVMEFLTYGLVIGLIALSLVATYWDLWRLATLWGF
jgi:regulator of sigma E protease